MKIILILTISLLFGFCAELGADSGSRLNASSNATMKASVQAIMSELSATNQEQFKKTLTGIFVLAQLAGMTSGKSKDEIEAAIWVKLDGKTDADVFALGQEIKSKMNNN